MVGETSAGLPSGAWLARESLTLADGLWAELEGVDWGGLLGGPEMAALLARRLDPARSDQEPVAAPLLAPGTDPDAIDRRVAERLREGLCSALVDDLCWVDSPRRGIPLADRPKQRAGVPPTVRNSGGFGSLYRRMTDAPPPRLYGIIAREAPVGVIFRRGPTRWVEIVRVDLTNGHVDRGAWFHGRIYERRCDLSPDGALLVYSAMKRTADPGYGHAWTAVSRPPWLTALVLWPKPELGTYHGGGLFATHRNLWVDHAGIESRHHPDHPPQGLVISWEGREGTVEDLRLRRDGWTTLVREPAVRERPIGARGAVLRRDDSRLDGPAYSILRKEETVRLAGAEWADVDGRGGVVFAREGCLYRTDATGRKTRSIVDLSADRPESRWSPGWARIGPTAP